MSTEQRRLLADKLFDGANIAAGALIFGQIIGSERFSWSLAVLGGTLWLASGAVAMRLLRG